MFFELQGVKYSFCANNFLLKAEQFTISCHAIKWMKTKIQGARYGFNCQTMYTTPVTFYSKDSEGWLFLETEWTFLFRLYCVCFSRKCLLLDAERNPWINPSVFCFMSANHFTLHRQNIFSFKVDVKHEIHRFLGLKSTESGQRRLMRCKWSFFCHKKGFSCLHDHSLNSVSFW